MPIFTAARSAGFMPGASPPLVRMPIRAPPGTGLSVGGALLAPRSTLVQSGSDCRAVTCYRHAMLQLATLGLIAYALWSGRSLAGVALMGAGLIVHLVMMLRLTQSLRGGLGAHAEWVREVSQRKRLYESPAWLAGALLIPLGAGVALWR